MHAVRLGVPRRRAGEPAAAAADAGSTPRCCRPSSASSRRCCSPIRRCVRRPMPRRGTPVQAAALGARDLRRRSDRARARDTIPRRPILGETLAAQRYLRSCGVRLDLVLVDEQALGIRQRGLGDAAGRARQRTTPTTGSVATAASSWSRRTRSPRPSAGTSRRARGSCSTPGTARSRRGSAEPTRPRRSCRGSSRRSSNRSPRVRAATRRCSFDNGIGGFTADGREYVRVGRRRTESTPAPWCNVLANPRVRLPRERVVARRDVVAQQRREPAHAVAKRSGARHPLRGPLPARRGDRGGVVADAAPRRSATARRSSATARGTRRTRRDSHGLEQELTVFVPPDAALKVVRLRLKNTLAAAPAPDRDVLRGVGARAAGARSSARTSCPSYDASTRVPPRDVQLERRVRRARRVPRLRSAAVHGFTTDRTEFLGRRGDYARPEALERWGLSGRVDPGVDPCAALQVHLELAPGEAARDPLRARPGGESRRGARARRALPRSRPRSTRRGTGLHAFWDDAARQRPRQDAGAGDGPHAQSLAALSEPVVAHVRSHRLLPVERRVRVSRPAPGRARARSTRRPSVRARTSWRRPRTSSRKATSCTGGIRRPAAACGRAAPTTWRGFPTSPPSTSPRPATSRSSTSRCRS